MAVLQSLDHAPLSESAVAKTASVQAHESTSALQRRAHLRAWDKLNTTHRESKFNIVVLGGSVTAGTHCTPGPPNPDCAFPARLGQRLGYLNRSRVIVSNRAVGGMHSLAALAQLEQLTAGPDGTDSEPDLLLLDFSANDWTLEVSGWAERAKYTEALLRQLCNVHPHVAVILMLTAVQGTPDRPDVHRQPTSCLRPLGNYSAVNRIASYYGFPTATYLDALSCSVSTDNCRQCWPPAWFHQYKSPTTIGFLRSTQDGTQHYEGNGMHPSSKTHELIGSFVASWWASYMCKRRTLAKKSAVFYTQIHATEGWSTFLPRVSIVLFNVVPQPAGVVPTTAPPNNLERTGF